MARILTVFVIAVILAACSGEPDTREPSPYFGSSLSLSSTLYTREINFDFDNIEMGFMNLFLNPSKLIIYSDLDKNLDLGISDGDFGGSGKIQNGKLSYSVGKPPANTLLPIEADDIPEISEVYKNITITPQNANAAFLNLTTNGPDYFLVTRENMVSESGPSMSLKITSGTTSYVYVDKNTTITAQGSNSETTMPIPINDETTMDFPVRLTTQNINLNLKTGWNAIHSTFIIIIKPLTFEAEGDMRFSMGVPSSHKWVLNSNYNDLIPTYHYRFP